MRLPFIILVLIVLASFAAPLITPFDPMSTNTSVTFTPPNTTHWFGTDSLGRDVFSRILHGGRQTLVIATSATLIAVIPGVVLGLLAGMASNWFDVIIRTMINSLLALPPLVIALVVLTILGTGWGSLAIATGISQIARVGQFTRSLVLSIRVRGYVGAAYALGGTWRHIVIQHILRNATPLLLSYIAVTFSYSILNSAALSFLGLGGALGTPDWGTMLAEGRLVFRTAPWISIVSGLVIVITVMCVNTLADRFSAYAESGG